MIDPPDLWDGVLRRLGEEVPAFGLDAWVRPLVAEVDGGGLRLLCPTSFHRDRVRERYLKHIVDCVEREARRALPVTLEARGRPEGSGCKPMLKALPRRAGPRTEAAARGPQQGAQGAAPRPDPRSAEPAGGGRLHQPMLPHSFENFVVAPCNALAREASLALAQGRQPAVSPLYLVSASGNGKTHLACSVVREASRRGPRVVYASAEGFTNELMASIRSGSTGAFKRRFRDQCDLLVLEDVQFLGGKTNTQLELFHTLEHLRAAGRPVVITADRIPREIARLDPRIGSLMASGVVAEIEPPGAETRRAILRQKAAAGGVHLPEPCLELLVANTRASIRDVEGVLTQIVASAALLNRPIDVELTEAALRKITPSTEGRPLAPEEVVRIVAAFFRITPAALASRSRRRDVLLPRQLAMYLCHRYSDASLTAIGHALGKKHSAVCNAISAVERAMLERAPLRYQVEALAARLETLAQESGPARNAGAPARRERRAPHRS
jgi:chromosomal replication initiator protein